jgi:hypothetical protein
LNDTLFYVIVKIDFEVECNVIESLMKYVEKLHVESTDIKRLRIFDFDDTLVTTDSKIWVLPDGKNDKKFSLTPAEFAVYERMSSDVMDYSEFKQLKNPQLISWMVHIFKNVYEKYGPSGIVILSARSVPEPIEQFLKMLGCTGVNVKALNDANPKTKAIWVDRWIREHELNFVEFFDDSPKNIAAIRELRHIHPGVNIVVHHVIHSYPRICASNT